ncbi:hypothetical protein [Litorivivens sp.]|uniref:hypothetical protein n=1 Tax=Litorivivens sp. TaxID=2020868 RepID=UPI00356A8048
MRTKYHFQEVESGGEAGAGGGGAADVVADVATGADVPAVDNGGQVAQVNDGDQGGPASFLDSLPENWRGDIAQSMGLDESQSNVLNRYSTFPDLVNSFFEQRNLIAQGQHNAALPENPTDEQLAEYRQSNGIPETPEGYELSLDDGLVLDGEDEAILGAVSQIAHAENVPAATYNKLVNSMLAAREIEAQAELEQHGLDQQRAINTMKSEWKADYQTNLNAIQGFLATMPKELREGFEHAQLPNGRKLFNEPAALAFFANTARALNPAATVVPNSANPVESINSEVAKIEAMMRDEPDKYYADPTIQNRLNELYAAQERMQQ